MAMTDVIKFFNHNNFIFANDNLMHVIERYAYVPRIINEKGNQWVYDFFFLSLFPFRMTEYDRKYFICDPRVVNWKKYYIVYVLGARTYLLRDTFDNYKEARTRMKRLKIMHYTVKYFFVALFAYILYISFARICIN